VEEAIAAALIMEPAVEVSIVSHLYDLRNDDTSLLFLRSVPGDLIVMGWLYSRAIRWLLDRNGIKGYPGQTLLSDTDEEDEDATPSGIGAADVPDRRIYCLDLREHSEPQVYIDEVKRIAAESAVQTVAIALDQPIGPTSKTGLAASTPKPSLNPTRRRWYPVIDYDRCTNCLECIDFCLFGVYGIDAQSRILVKEQDNCKQGCPACSRVCPEHAIIFPEHKTPAIAGASDGGINGLKIDLSKLFGGTSALDIAAKERDRELIKDGRSPVGLTVGIPKRRTGQPERPRDELDELVDGLDRLEL
jgi:NAD-dependent dihydropyrimidine dehydrogenase PreA subunit